MNKLSLILCLISLTIASACCATRWHEAAKTGNLEELQRLIETEPQNINEPNDCGSTPLHLAAESGSAPVILTLLNNGAISNQTDFHNRTPLHLAVQSGNTEAVRILLENGAKSVINMLDGYYRAPLHYAAENKEEEMLSALLQYDAAINQRGYEGLTPLHIAAKCGNEQAVITLFQHGAAINQFNNKYESTPLHMATESRNENVIRFLLENGALQTIIQRSNGITPLQSAIIEECNENIKNLLKFCQTIKEKAPKQMLAFLMAQHPRAGVNSPAHTLACDLYPLIYEFVKHPSLPNHKPARTWILNSCTLM